MASHPHEVKKSRGTYLAELQIQGKLKVCDSLKCTMSSSFVELKEVSIHKTFHLMKRQTDIRRTNTC